MIVIGLGTGRCGTASLAHLISAQPNSICFHELNPSCIRHSGTVQPILNTINEFDRIIDGGDTSLLTVDLSRKPGAIMYDKLRSMGSVNTIGDVAFYYLFYVDRMIETNKNIRFICLKRDREETIQSWMRKSAIHRWRSRKLADRISAWITRTPYYQGMNFWQEHDGTKWKPDPVWDKCFPNYQGRTKRESIAKYWDEYYQIASILEKKNSDFFRIFDMKLLNDPRSRAEILSFCGIAPEFQVNLDVHLHAME